MNHLNLKLLRIFLMNFTLRKIIPQNKSFSPDDLIVNTENVPTDNNTPITPEVRYGFNDIKAGYAFLNIYRRAGFPPIWHEMWWAINTTI